MSELDKMLEDLGDDDPIGSYTIRATPSRRIKITPSPPPVGGVVTGSTIFKPVRATTKPVLKVSPIDTTNWSMEEIDDVFGVKWDGSQLESALIDLGLIAKPGEKSDRDHLSRRHILVAGGCIVRHLMGTDIFKGDIDIFPANEQQLEKLIAAYADSPNFEKKEYAYTFDYEAGVRKTKVQIIHFEPQSVGNVFARFDFDHCRFGLIGGDLYTTKTAPISLVKRELKLRYVRKPEHSILRAIKYKALGFNADDALKKLAIMAFEGKNDVSAAEWEASHDYA